MSLFSAINTALSGLQAQTQALDIIGNNVANAQTPGYHRQSPVLTEQQSLPSPGQPYSQGVPSIGGGVSLSGVQATRDVFLMRQSDDLAGQVGRWTLGQQALTQIQSVISPGNNLDLSSQLNTFFSAWQALAANPETLANRTAVQSAGVTVAQTLNSQATQLQTLATQTTGDIATNVNSLNTLADTLGQLNGQIAAAQAAGQQPNDLLDQQETVRNQMAQLAGTTTLSGDISQPITNLGGHVLVEGTNVQHLSVVNGQIVWANQPTQSATIRSGQIAGQQELLTTVIPAYQTQLDDIAAVLANAVNAQHNNANNSSGSYTANGQPAGDFFTGTTAATIAVSAAIQADPSQIAAAHTATATGDGGVADAIANIANTLLIGNQTVGQAAQGMLGQIGSAVQSAQTNLDTATAMQTQVQTQQSSQFGVSVDEETANLLLYQRGYEASAHVLSVADDMMETLMTQLTQAGT